MQDLQLNLELDLIQRAVSTPARNDRLSSVSTTAKICQPILTHKIKQLRTRPTSVDIVSPQPCPSILSFSSRARIGASVYLRAIICLQDLQQEQVKPPDE